MSVRVLLFVLTLAVAALGGGAARAQTPTQARLDALRRQIALDEDRLSRAREAEDVTLTTLRDVEREMASRTALAETYALRAGEIAAVRDSLARTLGALTNDLLRLRADYRVRARALYQYGRINAVALLFSARSVNEMVARARYLRRFAADRRRRAEAIERAAAALSRRQQRLGAAETEAARMRQDAAFEAERLGTLQRQRASVVASLAGQRSVLEAEISRKNAAAAALEAEMRSVSASVASAPAGAAAAPRVAAEGARFTALRGRLPWPVPGVVTERFGVVVNPDLGTRTSNPGIVIATAPGTEVRAVAAGRVVRVQTMNEYGRLVFVRHGEFLTLYANLSSASVRVGDEVAAGAPLGRSGTSAEPRGAALFFAVFRDGTPDDPTRWLTP